MSQIKNFFSRVWRTLDSRFSRPQVKREHVLLYISLALILIGSFLIRILPYFTTELLLKGLDPWVQYRCALYLNENGLENFFNWYDQSSWYPYGRYVGKSMYLLVPFSAVTLYKAAMFLGINTTMLTCCYFVPAIFGTLTVLVIYKLGSVLHSKRTGLFAAFFIVSASGFMSRTIVGFFDNECIGIFFMFLCFYFFVKGVTEDNIVSSVFAGICLGGLSMTWGAYRYGYGILALYTLVMILVGKYSRRLLMTYSITLLIGVLMGALVPRNNLEFVTSAEQIIPLSLIVVMIFISVYRELQKSIEAEKLKRMTRITIFSLIGAAIVGVIVLYSLSVINPIAKKFLRTIFPPLAGSLPLIESVAENTPTAWAGLFTNVYLMIFLLPLGFYFTVKKPNEKTLFLLMMGLTSTYFGGSMARLSLIFAPAAAVVAGYTLDEVLRPFALINQERFTITRRKRRTAQQIGKELITVAYVFVAIFLMVNAIWSARYAEFQYGRYHELVTPLFDRQGNFVGNANDYQETFDFLRENIAPYKLGEKPPVVLSWWDYGYQINNLGNCTTLVDNATINSTQIGVVGAMLIHNESTSAKLCKKYGIDYVLVLSPGILGSSSNDLFKSQWMMKISEEHTPELGIRYEDYYVEGKPISEGGGFTDKYWDSVIYKLSAYKLNKDGYGGNTNQPLQSDFRNYQLFQNAPDINTLTNFRLIFQSKYCLLRLYELM